MRSLSRPSAMFAALFCLQFCVGSNGQAQEFRKQIGERHGKPIVNYHPDDPWTRGSVFNLQAGHAGFFYNCDNEECKRNSPYICWKPDHEKMFPTPLGWWGNAKQTCAEVKQRIRDGAGACARDCECTNCQSRRHPTARSRGYAEQKQKTPKFGSSFIRLANSQPPTSEPSDSREPTDGRIVAPRFGLISGRINNATVPFASDTPVETLPSALRNVASQNGLAENLRNLRKR